EGDPSRARALFVEALHVWRGEALSSLVDVAFVQPEITRLTEARIAALEARIDADLWLGLHSTLVGELEGLVSEYPLREHFWAQLMLALARWGRQAEALRAYQSARAVLGEELGLEPSEELRAVEAAIFEQTSAVTAPRATPSTKHRTNVPAPIT